MEASVIREMDIQDLVEALKTNETNLTRKKIGHKVASLENPIELRKIRRTVARIRTELRRRELEKANN
jgi:large subunit ribosomal protein L29